MSISVKEHDAKRFLAVYFGAAVGEAVADIRVDT